MSSEFERRLSVEELKQLNRPQTMPPQSAPMPPAYPPQWEWDELLVALNRLEAGVSAQEALLRALTRQVGQLPTQAQLEALAQDVAQMRAELKQAGKKKGFSVSPSTLETTLSVLIWLALILLGTMVGMVVLRTIWSGLAAIWSAVQALIP